MTDHASQGTAAHTPPVAERRRERHVVHGVELVDDYAWLRDANWREAMHDPQQLAPGIRAYLDAENAHTDAHMAACGDLRRELVAEMRARISATSSRRRSPQPAICASV